jgi:hypothetical protein
VPSVHEYRDIQQFRVQPDSFRGNPFKPIDPAPGSIEEIEVLEDQWHELTGHSYKLYPEIDPREQVSMAMQVFNRLQQIQPAPEVTPAEEWDIDRREHHQADESVEEAQ